MESTVFQTVFFILIGVTIVLLLYVIIRLNQFFVAESGGKTNWPPPPPPPPPPSGGKTNWPSPPPPGSIFEVTILKVITPTVRETGVAAESDQLPNESSAHLNISAGIQPQQKIIFSIAQVE